jgi:S-adenosylmethionine:tRNA ribosyltransferase-isomerase
MLPRDIRIDDYDFELPDDRIAKFPLEQRDQSRLLVFNQGRLSKDIFKNIPAYIDPGSLLVFNNSRVIPARLIFNKDTGARIELFLLEPIHPPDYQVMFASKSPVVWKCLVGNLKKWKEGSLKKTLNYQGKEFVLEARLLENHTSWQSIEFQWQDTQKSFMDLLENTGKTPIPPYLNREPVEKDKDWYQTVYSRIKGSVAAPTAGLHFTNEVLTDLSTKDIRAQEITLHIGAGTFQPVKSGLINQHPMHTEHFVLTMPLLKALIENKNTIVAVGTTTVRTLESIYWLGVKAFRKELNKIKQLHVNQWDGFDQVNLNTKEALNALYLWMENSGKDNLLASTAMMIAPGYTFRMTGRMITNFHQPRSTLLLLISAFIGEKWREVYEYALNNEFRFLSYGDSSILIPGS